MKAISDTHILVVDDNPDINSLIKMILEKEGFKVSVALDGASAITMTQSEKPDMVLLDVMMPNISGLDVLEKIRSNDNAAINSIPVVMITAKSSVEDVDKAVELGASGYIIKPFRANVLAEKVYSYLDVD